ncbi:MAG: aldose 1-epimerase family protein [Carbonactinosporaceae bacterium]
MTDATAPEPAAEPATEPVPPTGRQYEISAGRYRAVVVEAGAGIRELCHGDRPLLDGYARDEEPTGARGQLLLPWPNRIDRGRYAFRGEHRQLDITEPGRDTAIHGLTRWTGWTAAEQRPDRVDMTHRLHAHPGYPHVLDLRGEYALHPSHGLTVRVTATNVGAGAAPYGNGAHPYLTAGTVHVDDAVLTLPAAMWLDTDGRGIPAGAKPVQGTAYDLRTPHRLGDTAIDHAFTELVRGPDGRAWVRLENPDDGHAVSLWVDETYPWLQVFTGDALPGPLRRSGLAVEPMSCPPNAFATGAHVVVLDPGQSATGTWGIRFD